MYLSGFYVAEVERAARPGPAAGPAPGSGSVMVVAGPRAGAAPRRHAGRNNHDGQGQWVTVVVPVSGRRLSPCSPMVMCGKPEWPAGPGGFGLWRPNARKLSGHS
jgi:hypothetical protein